MFEPLSTSFAAYLAREIETAILFFEPRIMLNSVNFETEPDQEGLVLIKIDYTIRDDEHADQSRVPVLRDEATNA